LLKNQTLFCPDDNFHKMNAFNAADGKETIHPDEIFQDYKFSYKILSNKELEDKLLADSEPFYYLLFLRNSSAKMVGIVNSRTGEIIYCRYHKLLAFALNPGDLKEIYKEIK